MKLKLLQSDITTVRVDAIVNAANTSLLGGGGVDGAIHRKGGSEILEACRKVRATQGKCNPGEAVITTAGNLSAKYVIHTVGRVWNTGGKDKERLLANCYTKALRLAVENGIKTIAFPNISTGIYKFPKELAAKIAVDTVTNDPGLTHIKEVIFICFDEENYKIYAKIIEAV
ncbi:O-acetyl-ADP-ribose deacetylase [uncultured Aquimarina sp.]|uniref:O-acetyl-ADP-ribose deacetylase n=1 Tax=uncultured Aquimarina sp. TaxID=575652 RepID=UPI00260799AA|nr:O-acetyl-ADP-ribose deacetylase [uncultured Aquimarina sp.]